MDADDMAGHLIRRLNQSSTQIFLTRVREAGFEITPVQFASLDALREQPGIDQSRLAATIAYDRATIGGVVARLEAKGLVTRKISERDQRSLELQLTKKGYEVYENLLPIVQKIQDEIMYPLNKNEKSRFIALVRKLLYH